MKTHSIENKLKALPDDLKREASDFIDFLIVRKKYEKTSTQFEFTWKGGLSELKSKYSSVDLQHQSMEWR